MRLHTITSLEELFARAPQWRAAEAAERVPHVFVTFDWIAAYWRVFGSGKRLAVIMSDEATPEAIAPLMVTTPAPGVRRLELLGAGIHDFGDFVAGSPAAAERLWEHILHHSEWDALRLQQLGETSPALQHAPRAGLRHHNGRALRIERHDAEACPVLALPSTWEEYQSRLGKNLRYDLRRYARRLASDFNQIEFQLVTTAEQLDLAFAALIRLHGERWRQRGLPGMLASARRQRFQRELTHALLKRNRLRMFVLRLDDEPAAVLLNYFFGGKYFFYLGGFDPARERYRPGTLLFGHAIAHAIHEGATEFDFLRGQEEYKYRLGARDRPYHTVQVTRNTMRSRAANAHAHLETRILQRAREFAANRYRKS